MEIRVSWYEDQSGNVGEMFFNDTATTEIYTTAP
eukprot:COSAG06_NODE_74400_length_143_cov_33.090909_1_plen_33_part_10